MPTPHGQRKADANGPEVVRQPWRRNKRDRLYKQLYDASDYIKTGVAVEIDASYFAKLWVGVGLQIAANVLEAAANELLVEDIISENTED